MLVPLESSSAVLVMISSKTVSICNRSHARRANGMTENAGQTDEIADGHENARPFLVVITVSYIQEVDVLGWPA